MATVTGLTAERMQEMEDATVVDGNVVSGNLILVTKGGTQINAGSVAGPAGPPGPGMTACTSSTRPTHAVGLQIYETDTGKIYVSNGSAWIYAQGPGDLMPWLSAAAPLSWLLCFGQSLLRSSYPLLFNVIGTTYGAADGTHFNLPDLRGRQLTGLDNMGGTDAGRLSAANTLGVTGGEAAHILAEAELATHTHTQVAHTHTQPSHNHTQSSHSHSQDAHAHAISDPGHNHAALYGGSFLSDTGIVDPNPDLVTGGGGYAFNGNAAAATGIGIVAAQPAINGATAINNSATATNNAATPTNNNAGSSSPFNVMDPFMLVNWIIRER